MRGRRTGRPGADNNDVRSDNGAPWLVEKLGEHRQLG